MSATSTPDTSSRSSRAVRAVALAFFAFVTVFVLAVLFGTEKTSLVRALSDDASLDHVILFRARLPRVALAATAGAGLAAVGAALHALFRNPLAQPYFLRVSGGAALGATIAILAGLSGLTLLGATLVPLAALAGGLAATALVYGLARSTGSISGTEILLSGIIVNAVAAALVTFAKTLATAS